MFRLVGARPGRDRKADRMSRFEIAAMYLRMARDDVTNAERMLESRIGLARQYGLTDADIAEVLRGD